MRVTNVVFFGSPYQLIVKYFLISCKLGFFIFCNNVCFVKKVVRELMKKMTSGRAGMAAMVMMAATAGSAAMTTKVATEAMTMKKITILTARNNQPSFFVLF